MTTVIPRESRDLPTQPISKNLKNKQPHRDILVLWHEDPIAIDSILSRYTYIPVGEYAKHTKAQLFKN